MIVVFGSVNALLRESGVRNGIACIQFAVNEFQSLLDRVHSVRISTDLIPGFHVVEIGRRKVLNMRKEAVSQTFLHASGGTQQTPSPHIAQTSDEYGNADYI